MAVNIQSVGSRVPANETATSRTYDRFDRPKPYSHSGALFSSVDATTTFERCNPGRAVASMCCYVRDAGDGVHRSWAKRRRTFSVTLETVLS